MDDGTHKIVRENTPIGIPRLSASQISAIVPPTFVMGAEEAVPAIYGEDSVSDAWIFTLEYSLPVGR